MTDICIRAVVRPGRHRIAYLCAALAGVAAGLVIGLAARLVPAPIPASARVVTVTPVFGLDNSGTGRAEPADGFTITDPATVAKIAAAIDSLHPMQAGTYSCPAEIITARTLTAMQLTFRTTPGGAVVASVTADYTGCQFVWGNAGAQSIWLGGYTTSGQPLQQQVLAILGVRWPYPPG